VFSKAIVRKPGKSMVKGLTTAHLGPPDYDLALEQHAAYVHLLQSCGLDVLVLEADERFPDSTFVEDTALLTPNGAIITNPGAPSRRGEIDAMIPVVRRFYDQVDQIVDPGSVDAGDILQVDSHYYIGLSSRTNESGAKQMIDILNRYGLSGSTVKLTDVLHLKTAVAYLQYNHLVVCGEIVKRPDWNHLEKIEIPVQESYAANCIWVNDRVIIASGHPITRQKISAAGYSVIEAEMSEFQKLDGGLSCLSLRF